MKYISLTAAAIAFLPVAAQAATVDLSGWTENGLRGNNGAGDWTVQGVNNDSVYQSTNGAPTVFFDPGSNALGQTLAGTIFVNTSADDDFIGFVLGYSDGEFNSTSADFWVIDWKQIAQTINDSGVSRNAPAGLALSHVSGNIAATTSTYGGLWGHDEVVTEVQRGSSLGGTGWNDFTTYTFELTYTSSLIEVKVNGVTELSYTSAMNGAAFTAGAFGFYNSSQDDVRYAGITEEAVVPLPAALPLLLAGLGGLGLVARRRRG
ncbi:VPLPA-CTERM sorting domain-containing protein [Tropicibacter sp. S64]|uniref:VPLPA-CTERM sorting domain-containing protein n=1 Tax=Tropicibacter sp. S64 TaxID=3415122 RepID=UPI003C7C1004